MLCSLLLAACARPPQTLLDGSRYVRIGVMPVYEPELAKRTPPNWGSGEKLERYDVDFGLNGLVMERVTKAMGQGHQIVDLQSYAPAYIATPKIRSSGERKIIGDSRPLMSEVVRSLVGSQGLDAYVVIEGGPLHINEPQMIPAHALVKPSPPPVLAIQLSIYVIDGRTFEVMAAKYSTAAEQNVPVSWFLAPRQHVEEIRRAVVILLDSDIEPALRKVGLL